jgi:tRNA pseudouridine13 synthase
VQGGPDHHGQSLLQGCPEAYPKEMTMDTRSGPNIAQLNRRLAEPPFITGHLPGAGGVIKAAREHFQVEEVLPYQPCGEGEHVFVKLRRSGWNTADVAAALGRAAGVKGPDIGWAGRKDRNAVVTQTFSLRLPLDRPLTQIADQIKALPFEIIDLARHRNKLKTGHVAANRFSIVLSQAAPGADERVQAIAAAMKQSGVPNYYGEQRFGHEFSNLDRAAALLKRGRAHGKKEAFMVSVLQSALFNCWLIERIQRGAFDCLLQGDVARKTDTGGLFIVEDLQEAAQRFAAGRITYTGPIYGHKMMAAAGPAGDHEQRLLQNFGLALEAFKPLRAPGSRRVAVIHPDDLAVAAVAPGFQFSFTLPAGAYATTILREFTRSVGIISSEN